MRAFAVIALTGLTLAACSERAETAAPTPAETVSAVNPASDGEASVPVVLTAADLRRVCRAGLAAIHGQTVDAISIDGLEGQTVNASWRAPVDGGRMKAQCRAEGDLITWKPVDRPTAEQNRWMNQAGDPVVRFSVDGDMVAVSTTLPDGAVDHVELTVPVEARGRG